jgi:hypothetical protein
MRPHPSVLADSGERLEIIDVVGERVPEYLAPLLELHAMHFATHDFATERIVDDAQRDPARDGIVVHQFLLLVDRAPAGYVLIDSNLRRRIAPVHFLAIHPDFRDLTVGGLRIGAWLVRRAARDASTDIGHMTLGACGETPFATLGIFINTEWQQLMVDYREPVHGWHWSSFGLETREVALLWLPPDVLGCTTTADLDDDRVAAAAAAAFLIDTYRLPPDNPVVVALTGAQRLLDGANRDQLAGMT